MRKKLIFWSAAILLLAGGFMFYRQVGAGIVVENFHPLANWKDKSITVDLSDAVYRGIEIPTVKQLPGGKFTFTFNVANRGFGAKKLYYKIYYQDETYKFPEFEESGKYKYEHPLATRNFYGSWGETDAGFKPLEELGWFGEATVTDSFRIVGNPRNEETYFGPDDRAGLSARKIANMINYIRSREDWMLEIAGKANSNGVTIDQQVYRDAIWQIDNTRNKSRVNNRWKRNPRTGDYKFMLVVTTEEGLARIPASVQNVTQPEFNKKFINPFYYFLYGAGSSDPHVSVTVAEEQLNVKAKFDPGAGVYVNPFELMQSGIDTAAYCATCGTDSLLFRRAEFMQYFFYEDKSYILSSIPETGDVVADNYTRAQYAANKAKYENAQLPPDYIRATTRPCATVKADPQAHTITISNPGNTELPYRKENVGVKSRIGFTYGKFRVCVSFPEQLSADHVWNGLTNAVWLLYQDESAWNNRRACEKGYIPKTDMRRAKAERSSMLSYSEIDFEIMKSSRNWPATSYGKNPQPADDDIANSNNISVACTNWDLACTEPKNFSAGVAPLFYEKRRFDLHRWDYWYQALTTKTPADDDEMYQRPFYWYEIEWTPTYIVWRIGPDKEHMRVMAYMDDSVTSVPDNQMILVVSQEFHDSNWWVPAPYDQRFIPYPRSPLEGKIIAFEVE